MTMIGVLEDLQGRSEAKHSKRARKEEEGKGPVTEIS